MEVKHDAWKKVRWEFCEGQKYPWWEQCVEYSSKAKKSMDSMFMLGLNKTMDHLAMANSVHWDGHVLMRKDENVMRREDYHALRRSLDFEVEGQRKKGRPKRTWEKQVEEESVKVVLRKEDAHCRSKWSADINKIAAGSRCIWPPSLVGDTTGSQTLVYLSHISHIKFIFYRNIVVKSKILYLLDSKSVRNYTAH